MEIIDKNKASLAESQMQKEIFEWSAKEMNNFTANATSTDSSGNNNSSLCFHHFVVSFKIFFLFVCLLVCYI